jgi:hypothetical protein
VADIGAQDLNGSLRGICPGHFQYIRVDVVLDDPYGFAFADEKFDSLVSSSCFARIEMFWLTLWRRCGPSRPRACSI